MDEGEDQGDAFEVYECKRMYYTSNKDETFILPIY